MRTFTFAVLLVVGLLVPGQAAAQGSDRELLERASEAVRGYVHFGIFDDVEISIADRQATLTTKGRPCRLMHRSAPVRTARPPSRTSRASRAVG